MIILLLSATCLFGQTPQFDATSADFRSVSFYHAYPGLTRSFQGQGFLSGWQVQIVYTSQIYLGVTCLKATATAPDSINTDLLAKDIYGGIWRLKETEDGSVIFAASSLAQAKPLAQELSVEDRLLTGTCYEGMSLVDENGDRETIVDIDAALPQYPGHTFVLVRIDWADDNSTDYSYYHSYVGAFAMIFGTTDITGSGFVLSRFDDDIDGMPDEWEQQYNLSTMQNNAHDDYDTDNLINLHEYNFHTNPRLADTDGDTMNDGLEASTGFDPTDKESIFKMTNISLTPSNRLVILTFTSGTADATDFTVNRGYDSPASAVTSPSFIDNGDGTSSWIDQDSAKHNHGQYVITLNPQNTQ